MCGMNGRTISAAQPRALHTGPPEHRAGLLCTRGARRPSTHSWREAVPTGSAACHTPSIVDGAQPVTGSPASRVAALPRGPRYLHTES